MDYRFKTKPFQHQLDALEQSWNKEVWALFMEMGTGKTKVCIDNIAILYDNEKKALEKGYQIIWLDVMDAQPQAYKFYKKLGYKYFSHERLTYNLLYNKVRKMSQFYKLLNN